MNNPVTTRLNKRMAELGLCSRREADAWIERGWVRVNGEVASMGMQVAPDARITVDKQAQGQQAQRVTVLLNKPMGFVSGQAEDGHEPAITLINPRSHWRQDSSGLRFTPPQLMDYEGFRQMVLGADLRPVKTNEMKDLIDVGRNHELVYNPYSKANNSSNQATVKLAVESVQKDEAKLILQHSKPDSYEAKNFREFKKLFDKLLTKNPKFENEEEVVSWLRTVPTDNYPQIFTFDFEIGYLVSLCGIMAKWMKKDLYETKRTEFAWFLDFLTHIASLKAFAISVKPMLKSAEKIELRKTLDQLADKNQTMLDIVEDLKAKYIK